MCAFAYIMCPCVCLCAGRANVAEAYGGAGIPGGREAVPATDGAVEAVPSQTLLQMAVQRLVRVPRGGNAAWDYSGMGGGETQRGREGGWREGGLGDETEREREEGERGMRKRGTERMG